MVEATVHAVTQRSGTALLRFLRRWRKPHYDPIVIDAEEFEAAHDDPEWLAFCEKADDYLATVEKKP